MEKYRHNLQRVTSSLKIKQNIKSLEVVNTRKKKKKRIIGKNERNLEQPVCRKRINDRFLQAVSFYSRGDSAEVDSFNNMLSAQSVRRVRIPTVRCYLYIGAY